MKKKLTFLLLTTLVMALCLCATAAANSIWDDGPIIAPEYKPPVWVRGLADGQTGYLAGYDDQGKMVGLRVFHGDGASDVIDGAARYKLLRLGDGLAPQGEALAFSPDESTVRKVDGRVCFCYGDPEGLMVAMPWRSRVIGQVTSYTTSGALRINGKEYQATTLAVEGCDMPISAASFQNWIEYGGFSATYAFYLDPQGAVCWIDQRTESDHTACLPLQAQVQDGNLLLTVQDSAVSVRDLNVVRLDGKPIGDGAGCISPADTLAQLEADYEKAFYTFGRWLGGGYHLVRAGKDSPVDTGFAKSERYVIPEGTTLQPAADFTSGAIPCLADENTMFWIAVGAPGRKTYSFHQSFQQLPASPAKGCVLTGDNGAAYLVYLDIPYVAAQPPEGCVFIASNSLSFDPELIDENVYRAEVMDADGSMTSLPVAADISQAIGQDSMEQDVFSDNTYVGRYCRVTAMDEYGTAWGLEPVETCEVQALGNGEIVTTAGTWECDSATYFVYVDLIWRTDSDDTMLASIADSGSFSPNGFFNPNEVGPELDKMYSSVRAAVLPDPNDETLAQYVYVIQEYN